MTNKTSNLVILFFFSTVPVGGTLTMMVIISLNNQKANCVYLYLIKLLEGEDGCGTCYKLGCLGARKTTVLDIQETKL